MLLRFELEGQLVELAGELERNIVAIPTIATPVRVSNPTSKDSSSGNVTGVVWSSVFLAAFGARAVVATDVDDQGVVEFAEVFDLLDDPSARHRRLCASQRYLRSYLQARIASGMADSSHGRADA